MDIIEVTSEIEKVTSEPETKMQPIVSVKNAYKYYGSKRNPFVVLNRLNMSVSKGTIYGLLGASGCGKTTLLNCIVGRRKLNAGKIWVFGFDGCNIRSSQLGFMPQDTALYAEFTIRETLWFFGWIAGMKLSKIEERSNFLINLLMLPESSLYVKGLSGGQQRRVSLAAALINEPELLLLDEPTVGLDSILRENIWDHLLDLTNNGGKTVIITTHYIEETGRAHKIALMRGGHFLSEDSPKNILHQYGFDRLEDVFLHLSILQDSNTSITDDQICKTIPSNNEEADGIFNKDFTVRNVNFNSTKDPSKNEICFNKSKYQIINTDHLKALLWKSFLWIIRNIPMLLCVLVLPLLQATLICLCIGHDPFNLAIAVVNSESDAIEQCTNNITCNTIHLGCHFLKYLEAREMLLEYYDSEEAATISVLSGKTYASVIIHHNYTDALKTRLDAWNQVEPWDINNANIYVIRDNSNLFMEQFLQATFYRTFKEFVEDYLASCNTDSRWIMPPIKWETPVYGKNYPSFTDFVAPGVILTFTSFMGMGLTGLAMLLETKEGILDRLLISGVNEVEILISHCLSQFIIMVMQSVITLVTMFIIFDITNEGSLAFIFLITIMSGFFGMCLGLCFSCIFSSEIPALFAAMGTFLPMFILAGIIWPIEGMHYLLQSIVFLLPLTLPTESLRSIMQKGWGISTSAVYTGFIVTSVWAVLLIILSIVILKCKKY